MINTQLTDEPQQDPRDQLAAAIRCWLAQPAVPADADDQFTIAEGYGVDSHWPADEGTYFLASVEELIADARNAGDDRLAAAFASVGLWPVTDGDGLVDGFLLTLDTPAGRRATLHHESRELRSDDDVDGVDAAVEALLAVDQIGRDELRNDVPTDRVAKTGSDQLAVDSIAALLGTNAEWRSAASYLEDIANIVGTVRPHPGDRAATYRQDFREATGRDLPSAWDATDDND